MKILSIDAWGNREDGYEWNNWFYVADIDKGIFESLTCSADYGKKVAEWFCLSGITTTSDMRKIVVEDDGHNIVLIHKKTGQPQFAIEYGPEY